MVIIRFICHQLHVSCVCMYGCDCLRHRIVQVNPPAISAKGVGVTVYIFVSVCSLLPTHAPQIVANSFPDRGLNLNRETINRTVLFSFYF